MAEERCTLCREAGFPNVLAHFKGVSAGMSTTGKAEPPLCWDHKHGKVPRFLAETTGNSLEAIVDQTHREIAGQSNGRPPAAIAPRLCACGCGDPMPEGYSDRLSFIRGHKTKHALAKSEPVPVGRRIKPVTASRGRKIVGLVEVLQDLRGLLDAQRSEIDRNLTAVDVVIELVLRADQADSAAEFVRRRA